MFCRIKLWKLNRVNMTHWAGQDSFCKQPKNRLVKLFVSFFTGFRVTSVQSNSKMLCHVNHDVKRLKETIYQAYKAHFLPQRLIMSAFSVLASLPENHFQCSICLNVFTDPVTTPCGHNFCKTCLSEVWDNSDSCRCPACNKRFHMRPETSTNEVLEEISVQVKRRKVEVPEMAAAPWQVKCDLCTGVKLRALKSCLACLTSYCEAHLEPHLRVPSLMRHKLIEPVDDLEMRMCGKHERLLELFCRDEQACICLLCGETDHKHHDTVPVEEEGARQKVRVYFLTWVDWAWNEGLSRFFLFKFYILGKHWVEERKDQNYDWGQNGKDEGIHWLFWN